MGRRAIVLLVALILAGLAGWAVWNYLQSVSDQAQEGQNIVTVFRAGAGGIAEGQEGSILLSSFNADARCNDDTLDRQAQAACRIRRSTDIAANIPVDAISSAETLREFLAGKIAAGPISENAILTRSQWVQVSVLTTPLADLIPSGKQALTISVGQVQGVNGFIEAGDRINLIITVDIPAELIPIDVPGLIIPDDEDPTVPGGTAGAVLTYTRYVMQGIPVIAVGQQIRPDETGDLTGQVPATPVADEAGPGGNPTVFTLEVTPEQAERIVHAFSLGSIWLTLVPPDFVEVDTQGVILDNLFGGSLIEDIFGN